MIITLLYSYTHRESTTSIILLFSDTFFGSKMKLIRSQLVCVFVSVFILLLCGYHGNRVEGERIIQVANIGDDITLNCYRGDRERDNWKRWYRNGTSIVGWTQSGRINIQDPRITLKDNQHGHLDSNIIYISNITINDSANYKCSTYHEEEIILYDVRVIGCSCSLTNHKDPMKEKVICNLDNYSTTDTLQSTIIINEHMMETTKIQGNAFSFPIFKRELYTDLKIEFNPYSNVISNIECILPAQLTSPHPSSRYPTTPFITPLVRITRNGGSTASHTALLKLTSGEQITTTKHLTPQNKNSNPPNNMRNYNVTVIIIILGFFLILILIVVIIVLQWKQRKHPRGNKRNDNVSIDNKVTKEHPETCYESTEDGTRNCPKYATSIEILRKPSRGQESANDPDNDGLVDNILYDSSDKFAESSISRLEGPLDNALYAMPEKRGTLNRESKLKTIHGSSNSDILYGNSVIISQHEENGDTLQRGDHYENVEMPGPGSGGDAEEIALYVMPDKGLKRNTLKASPKAGKTSVLSKDEVVDVDALYSEVDKNKEK